MANITPIAVVTSPTYGFSGKNLENGAPFQFDMKNSNGNGNEWGNMSGLTDKVTRIRFIRKVYLILTTQVIFTFGIVAIFVFVKPVKDFASTKEGFIAYIISYCIYIGLIFTSVIIQCCKPQIMRKKPFNYIFLGLITATLSFMLGMVSSYHRVEGVLIAVGITLFVTVGVTLFSIQTKYDFTTLSCFCISWLTMICLTLALLGFGIAFAAIHLASLPYLQAAYGGIGAAFMAFLLARNTQQLMGNKKYKFDEEDYIDATLNLYLDVCSIFVYILIGVGK